MSRSDSNKDKNINKKSTTKIIIISEIKLSKCFDWS